MPLTAGQLTSFATNINAQGPLAGAISAKDATAIVNFYSALSSGPAVPVWRRGITPGEVTGQIVFSDFVALTAIRQNGLMVLLQGNVDATLANVRASFTAIFGAGSATLTNMTALAQRTGTKFEAIAAFITAAAPANVSSVLDYPLSALDVQLAMGWAT